jgi:hypothetical protein
MRSGLTNRIVRLETARGRADGLFFVAWGRDQEEIEQTLADARASGAVRDGDTVVRAVWPNQTPLPRSRWVPNQIEALSPAEFDALADMSEAIIAAECDADIVAALADDPIAACRKISALIPDHWHYLETLNDVQLIARIHGRPLEATAS